MANYAENKKARFEYEMLDKYEAGLELSGSEVKSIRAGRMSLEGSFAIVRGGEAFLMNANIPPYQPNNIPEDYEPLRTRRLLLTKKEILELTSLENGKNLTIVPMAVYNKGKKVKIALAIGRGKKKFDKRETIKWRETEREIRREHKGR